MGRHRDPLDSAQVQSILEDIDDDASLAARIERISARFLGLPYIENPLDGGPDAQEVLTASLDAFDCVTYIETAHALALSKTASEFIDALRKIRYEGGKLDWFHRNHYMTDWLRRNEARHLIANLTTGPETIEVNRSLAVVKGLPRKPVVFRCFPKRRLSRIAARIETGDLIFFASARRTLDVFHAGLLVRQRQRILLRHATRKLGRVIEQELADFLRDNRMTGFIVARPLAGRRKGSRVL